MIKPILKPIYLITSHWIAKLKLSLFSILLVVLITACGEKNTENNKTLFTLLSPEKTGIAFTNNVKDQKDFNIFTYRNFYNGGGVAIGDINNDGLADIYFTSSMNKNKLYLNKGGWKFEDITEKAGVGGTKSWSTGVTMADVNDDGLLDIYVCNSGLFEGKERENELFINNGDLTFSEKGKLYGLNDTGYTTHASFFDYDLDGDLDCYILNDAFKSIDNASKYVVKREISDPNGGDKLLRNDNGSYTDVTEEAGIHNGWIGFGLGASVSDLNGDMLPDIYISNDFWERDYMYINNGDGTFSDEIISRTTIISASSMGADISDLNNDGFMEIFTTDMLPGDNYRLHSMTNFEETNIKELQDHSYYHHQILQNCLQVNDGNGFFKEMAFTANTAETDWSWGALMFDMNNDGWKDIFVSNGIYRDITSKDFANMVSDRDSIKKIVEQTGKFDLQDLLSYLPSSKISNYAFVNQKNKTFSNLSDSLGLATPSFSNGAAYGDLDNDGDLDLVVNNLNMQSFVYRNNADTLLANNFLKVKFKGPKGNAFGIGTKVNVYARGNQQVRYNMPSRSFESAVEPQLLFGLGNISILDSLEVTWPDTKRQTLKNIKANQILTIHYENADNLFKEETTSSFPMLTDVTNEKLSGNLLHRENKFNDFKREKLLPKKLSTEGPKIIKGELNGDDLDDFVLLGAYGDYDKVFIQQANGKFRETTQRSIIKDSIYESTCGVSFDPDNDGDQDILIGSGGNEFDRGINAHLLRYYENDGKGNFTRRVDLAPPSAGNFSCILAKDFDLDGDEDLFIGGRVVPGNYGLIPQSYLFRNDNNKWTDITPKTLAGAGMVTDAGWSDFDCDGLKDLIVVGEWMPVKVYKNNGTNLQGAHSLSGTEGWWSTIEITDLNNDDVEDFVLGNWGLNSKFQATQENPITMYVDDFDNNGKSEFIINWYPPKDSVAYPYATKKDIVSAIPMLNKNIQSYDDYAKMSYKQMFPEELRKKAIHYKASYLQSAVLWNYGQNKFKLEALPIEAQVAPVYAIAIDDLNGDNIKDLLLCGNFYDMQLQYGRQSSNFGVVLIGNNDNGFVYASNKETGIRIQGQVRDAKTLTSSKGKKFILLARNNDSAIMLATNPKVHPDPSIVMK